MYQVQEHVSNFEYQLVTANDPIDLGERVRQLLAEGWTCCGGVSVTSWIKDVFDGDDYTQQTRFTFVQALTRSKGVSWSIAGSSVNTINSMEEQKWN